MAQEPMSGGQGPAGQSPTGQDPSPTPPVNTPAVSTQPAVPPPAPALPGGLNSLQGLRVAGIQINSPAVHNPEVLISLLPQKANEPLDRNKVRQSVQALYNTGRFAEIQVEAQRTPKGEVVLVFDARENYFFGSLLAEGSPGRPSDSQLI